MYIESEHVIIVSVLLALCVGYLVFNIYKSIAAEQEYQLKSEEANALLAAAKKRAEAILRSSVGNAREKAGGILKDAQEQGAKEVQALVDKAEADMEQKRGALMQEMEAGRQSFLEETEEIDAAIRHNKEYLDSMGKEMDIIYGTSVVLASGATDLTVLSTMSDEELKERWTSVRKEEQSLIRDGVAVILSVPLQGKRFAGNSTKRILRNFNSDCDCYMAWLPSVGVDETKMKIQQSFDLLNKLYEDEGVAISKAYLSLKMEEVDILIAQNRNKA